MLLLAAILLPAVGGALLPALRLRTPRRRAVYVEAVTLLSSALVCAVLLWVPRGLVYWLIPDLWGGTPLALALDDRGALFAGLVALLWPLASLYGFAYLEGDAHWERFFAWYTVTYGVTLLVAFSANLLTLFVGYEFLTLSTLPLVAHKGDPASRRAGLAYAAWTFGGSALGLIALGFVIQFSPAGAAFTEGGILVAGTDPQLVGWLFLAAFLGFGVKAAVLPTSPWLPMVSVAPTPVTALLHAVAVVNTGAFAVQRLVFDVFGPDTVRGTLPHSIALGLACATVLAGSMLAVREQHLKRRLAWSTVSNLSYMLMGALLLTPAGLQGSQSHFLYHSFMKMTLFLCAGAILTGSGREYVQQLRGLARKMPFTCAVFTLAGCALVGIPPLCGFVSKWQLLTAAGAVGGWQGTLAIGTLIASAVLTAIYLMVPAVLCFFRPLTEDSDEPHDPDWRMKVPLILLSVLVVFSGISFQ